MAVCTFNGNEGRGFGPPHYGGGALDLYGNAVDGMQLEQCVFTNNAALKRDGGAIRIVAQQRYDVKLVVRNCTISANSAANEGGAFCATNTLLLLEDTLLHANQKVPPFSFRIETG